MKPQRKLVSFIAIGCRSASPLLYTYIDFHPDIFVVDNDTNFFGNTKIFAKGIDWYESQFRGKGTESVCGELAYDYLKNPTAISLIARTYPSAKLLAVIENPLVSVRVAYVEARRAKTISRDTSLAMFLKQNPEVLAEAKYGRQLSQYFGYYSQNDLLVVPASDVRDDALGTIKKVYAHVGVDDKFVPLALQHLVPEEDQPIKRPGIIKRTIKGIKKLIVGTYKAIINKINPPKIPIETASIVARQIPLSPELEEYLIKYYRQDVTMLSNILQRDFTGEWGFDV